MDLKQKLVYVEQHIKNIAGHDDEAVKAVVASLKSIKTTVDVYIKATYARRVGNRFAAYFTRLYNALLGN